MLPGFVLFTSHKRKRPIFALSLLEEHFLVTEM